MRSIAHFAVGPAADVLELVVTAAFKDPPADHAVVRVRYAPVHPGDVLGIEASPAFGGKPEIPAAGRIPGWEGVGIIEEVNDTGGARGFNVGDRVAFFPASGAWSDYVIAPLSSLVKVPDLVSDVVAAQMLINSITAAIVVRAAQDAIPSREFANATVIQTGAASAVGRLITRILLGANVFPIRVTRSITSAKSLETELPQYPALASSSSDFSEQLKAAVGARGVRVAIDSVGGPGFHDIAFAVEEGGTIFNYGSLGGALTDIRAIVPRRLSVVGLAITSWGGLDDETRREDIASALRLAMQHPTDFTSSGVFKPEQFAEAIARVTSGNGGGTALFEFSAS